MFGCNCTMDMIFFSHFFSFLRRGSVGMNLWMFGCKISWMLVTVAFLGFVVVEEGMLRWIRGCSDADFI